VPLDDFRADGQAHSGAFVIRFPDQAVEGLEKLMRLCRIEANAIVFYNQLQAAIPRRAAGKLHYR
jgi:hypothetical protein